MRFDLDELRLALASQVRAVLAQLGYEAKGARNQLECARCPDRVHGRRRAMVVNVSKASWHCYVCGTGGDMLALVAATRGLDTRASFGDVVRAAAELVGLAPAADEEEAKRRRAEAERRMAEMRERLMREEERDAKERAHAVAKARALWPILPTVPTAEAREYLASRKLSRLTSAVVRGTHHGIAVPLYSSRGEIVNVVTRRWPRLGEPKTMGRKGCPSLGTMIGHLGEIVHGGDVVLCEGVADSLTARLAWPHATILGAHGGENLPKLAEHVARAVFEAEGRLLFPAHDDKAGAKAGIAVAMAAVGAGLVDGSTLELVDLGDAKDLNDAWCGGWRP